MKREKLRKQIAVCILDTLAYHKLTLPNVLRYVTSRQLTLYRICEQTKITARDYEVALNIARGSLHGKPNSFRYARRGSAIAKERELYIISSKLVDLIKS